jgi:hypothetical protein
MGNPGRLVAGEPVGPDGGGHGCKVADAVGDGDACGLAVGVTSGSGA